MTKRTDSLRPRSRLAVVLAVLVASVVVAGGAAATGAETGDGTGKIAPAAAALSDTDTRAQTAGSTVVRLTPTTATVAGGNSQKYDIVVSDTEDGIGAITATISIEDTDVASIGDIELNGDPGEETVDVESDGSKVFVRAALMDTDDSGAVTVGTVTVEGTGQGSSDILIDVESLGNEGGEPYDVGATPGSSLTVEGSANAVPLNISSDESTVDPGDRVDFEVRRVDDDALVSATVHINGESFETGIDGVATVIITDEMGSDAGTITAVASKEATAQESFRNDSVTLDIGGEEPDNRAEPETPTRNETPVSGDDSVTSTVVLSVSKMPNGFERASITVRTAVDASVTDSQGDLVSDSQLRVVSDGQRSTTVQAVDLAGNVDAFEESRTIVELTYDQRLSAEDVEIEVENLQNDNGASVSGDRISLKVAAGGLFEKALQGADTDAPPTDPDADGLYEDVNGDGEVSFDDAVALSFVDATELGTEQVAAFDFDDDGDLDIDDAVALAFE